MTRSSVSFVKIGLTALLTFSVFTFIIAPAAVSAAHAPSAETKAAVAANPADTSAPKKNIVSKLFSNIGLGFRAVGKTFAGWFQSIGRLLGLVRPGLPEGAVCDEVSDCGQGLVCLNTCFDRGDCEVFEKLCTPVPSHGTTTVAIKQVYASCGEGDLCTKGTDCTRTCPEGVECEVTNRCLEPVQPIGSCTEASDCQSVCGSLPYPPIGPSAFRPECRDSACFCETEDVQPNLHITACPAKTAEETILCPTGFRPACTNEGCVSETCDARLTCLTDPAFGGQCLRDDACAEVSCSKETEPFCDTSDNSCRCRASAKIVVNCTSVDECQDISCPDGQARACVSNVCACEKKTLLEEDFVCTEASQCPSNCPEEFSPACVEGSCACQRVRENVPVNCSNVSDCGGVSCPEDFEKVCLDGTCACTKTTLQ